MRDNERKQLQDNKRKRKDTYSPSGLSLIILHILSSLKDFRRCFIQSLPHRLAEVRGKYPCIKRATYAKAPHRRHRTSVNPPEAKAPAAEMVLVIRRGIYANAQYGPHKSGTESFYPSASANVPETKSSASVGAIPSHSPIGLPVLSEAGGDLISTPSHPINWSLASLLLYCRCLDIYVVRHPM